MSDYFDRLLRKENGNAHFRADTDADAYALHHTLGKNPNQASPGNHNHDDNYVKKTLAIGVAGILSGAQAIANGSWTVVTNWTTSYYLGPLEVGIVWEGAGVWRIDNTGWYTIQLGWAFNGSSNGSRFGSIVIDGVRIRAQGYNATAAHTQGGFLGAEIRINAGSRIRLEVYQDAGGTINMVGDVGGGDYRSWYTIRKVAD